MIPLAIFTCAVSVTFLLVILIRKVAFAKRAEHRHEKLQKRKQEVIAKDAQLQVACVDELLDGSSLAEAGQRLCSERNTLFSESDANPIGHWEDSHLKKFVESESQIIDQQTSQSLRSFVAGALVVALFVATVGNLVGYQFLSRNAKSLNEEAELMDQPIDSVSDSADGQGWVLPDPSPGPSSQSTPIRPPSAPAQGAKK